MCFVVFLGPLLLYVHLIYRPAGCEYKNVCVVKQANKNAFHKAEKVRKVWQKSMRTKQKDSLTHKNQKLECNTELKYV